MENLKFFKGSLSVTFAGLLAAYFYGGYEALIIVSILAVLEVSLSFDNAVVNAKVLNTMSEIWQKRFLTWGILIAVFGMRLVFPLLIVIVATGMGPIDTIDLALNNPDRYASYLEDAHVSISAFGGAFLMMVGLSYFLDEDKEINWIPFIEEPLSKLSHNNLVIIITLMIVLILPIFLRLDNSTATEFTISGAFGILTFLLVDLISSVLNDPNVAVKGGLGTFLYLEVLDMSFSGDGVIAAFAISTNLVIITIGLGIGAMFVRSLTIMLVKKGTLQEYEYLEPAAFYAIMVLASIMFLKTGIHIPDLVTGLLGACFIIAGFLTSIYKTKVK